MNKFQSLCIGAILGILPLSVATKPAAAINIVQNGGFEQPDIPTGTFKIQNPIPGTWTLTPDSDPNAGIEVQDNVAGSPYEGNQFVELDGTAVSGIYQDLTTVVGQAYTLSFAFSPSPDVADNRLNVYWGGNLVDNLFASGVGKTNTDWKTYAYNLIATSTTTRLRFDNLDELSDGLGPYIDDVSVTPVPEPLTMGGLTIGLGFGAFLKNRYGKKNEQIKKA
ncbi:PEP-CTERM sorting domain-containing protein [Nostoc piscinale]|uniref:PEP-CTERM sorting domain-containing protein n=1 Tax=Nostoc piscinale TaxID=224012 RepID=UPI00078269F0|nr:PEP-CTERM sorting domain-containing protein [Nostoc piscinale]